MRRELKKLGFTLVEQIVVLSLIVAVLGFGMARFSKMFQEDHLDRSIKDLTVLLQLFQLKAVEDGRIYEISLKENKREFVAKRSASEDGSDLREVSISWLRAFQPDRSLELDFERDRRLLFYPDGSSSKNRIILSNEKGDRALLRLRNRIGTVQVEKSGYAPAR